jgi:acyl-CoA synthetase (AMP-forming)/AMP-acid ligase II
VIGSVAAAAADRFGHQVAYVAPGGTTVTYAQLHERADRAAAGLAEAGVGEGDVVALTLPASPEYVIAYLAASRVGALTAGINTRLAQREQAALLTVAHPALTISTPHELPSGTGAPPPLPDEPERPVALVFTSGTTGTPKGVVFSSRQLAAITAIDTGGVWGGGGAQLAGTSFATLGPMTKLAGTLMKGGTTHLVERWRAHEALELTEQLGLTAIAGIPTQVALMLRDPTFDQRDLSSVRAVVMGGGPATPALVREVRARLGVPVAIRYSCTEAGIGVGTGFTDPPEDAEVSVGRPHPGITLTIRADNGSVLPAGEEGEVCLASAAVMSGYFENPSATAAAMTADGAVRTGDVGWVDGRGRLRLTGRAKEIYVRGGYNVAPQQVEAVLADMPGVADIAVVSQPDEVMGEVGVAVVVPADPAAPPTLEQVRAFGAEHLARHELPERVLVVEALPLTPAEKVDRRALTEQLHHRS